MDELEKYCAKLLHSDASVRAAAAEHLCQSGTDAAKAAVELVRACSDEDESVQTWVTAALEDMGPPPSGAVKPLSELVANENTLVAYWAITLLGRLGAEAKAAEDALAIALVQSSDRSVQEQAAWALGKIGASSNETFDALELAAKSDNQRLVRLANQALSQTPS